MRGRVARRASARVRRKYSNPTNRFLTNTEKKEYDTKTKRLR